MAKPWTNGEEEKERSVSGYCWAGACIAACWLQVRCDSCPMLLQLWPSQRRLWPGTVGQIHGFSTKLFCRSVSITANKEHKATYNLPAAQLLKGVLAFTVTPELCRNLVLHTFSSTWFYQNFKYLKTWWLWLYFTASCWNPHKYQALEHSVGRLGITGSWLWEKMVSDS